MSLAARRTRRFLDGPSVRRTQMDRRNAVVAAEQLEERTLLSAGSLIFNLPYDISPVLNDSFNDVAVQADGKIVAVGRIRVGDVNHFLVARFNANGALDNTFSGDGVATVQFGANNSSAVSVALRPDGKILIGGALSSASGDKYGITQLNSNGTLDLAFGNFGRVIWEAPEDSVLIAGEIALNSQGKLAVSGYYYLGVETVGFVRQYNASGALDNTFDGDGVKQILNVTPTDIAFDAADRLVIASSNMRIYRLNPNGSFDTTFSGDGLQMIGFEAGINPIVRSLAIDDQGRIVVAGNSEVAGLHQAAVVRLLPNGAYDNSFHANGRVSFSIAAGSDLASEVQTLPGGGVVVAGRTTGAGGDWVLALLRSDGQFETAFSGDGKRSVNAGGTDSLGGIAITAQGDIILAGQIGTGFDGVDISSALAKVQGLPAAEDLVGFFGGEWYVGRSMTTSFETSLFAKWANVGWDALRYGDFNGDGRTDVLGLLDGQWWVGIAHEDHFETSLFGTWSNLDWQNVTVGDINRDGRDDILARVGGAWWASHSTGNAFLPASHRATWANIDWLDVSLTDLNGDGYDDLLGRTGGQWWAATSAGAAFVDTSLWGNWADAAWTSRMTLDANGDGLTDVAGLINGEWYVGLSNGTSFNTALWAGWANVAWQDARVGDFNGDGRDDVIARQNGQWWVGLSNGAGLSTSLWSTWANIAWQDVRVGDFTGDGKDDLVGRSGGQWWVGSSTGTGFSTSLWGTWANIAWQAVAAAEVARRSTPLAMIAAPPADAGNGMAYDSDEMNAFWSTTEDEELEALLLA